LTKIIQPAQVFNERIIEIESALSSIKLIIDKKGKEGTYSDNFINILYSNVVLMLYNIIESTANNSAEYLYASICKDKLTAKKLNPPVRQVWLESRIEEAYQKNSTFYTYKNTTSEIVSEVIEEKHIDMKNAKVRAGNVDSEYFRDFCKKHGIRFDTSVSKGGLALDDIKSARNSLAHGEVSFTEWGRQKTIDDLNEYKIQVFKYLGSFLESIQLFVEGRVYANL